MGQMHNLNVITFLPRKKTEEFLVNWFYVDAEKSLLNQKNLFCK